MLQLQEVSAHFSQLRAGPVSPLLLGQIKKYENEFLSPPVLMHSGLSCIAQHLSVHLYVYRSVLKQELIIHISKGIAHMFTKFDV